MDYLPLIGWTAAKIGLVLAVILAFAPVLIWAERRQSAMIQDRIGPRRAGIPQAFVKKFVLHGSVASFVIDESM